ncbi:hypothetical protein Naga_100778g3 [Nannochloropsis gaditana]|uniref:Uncharacterized protein n=1 Tax=Nannochloropsis gaditana TaxID=72520 RepID=W7TSE3_9STRA|nr:hypothetical protein Naga_100778g3 [Nannochloropsis gaditana]
MLAHAAQENLFLKENLFAFMNPDVKGKENNGPRSSSSVDGTTTKVQPHSLRLSRRSRDRLHCTAQQTASLKSLESTNGEDGTVVRTESNSQVLPSPPLPPRPDTVSVQVPEMRSRLGLLKGLSLRFISTQGRGWDCPLPPSHVPSPAGKTVIKYVGAAFVDPATQAIKVQRGFTISLKVVDEAGEECGVSDNPRPWPGGGVYYFERVILPTKGLWTLKLTARESRKAGVDTTGWVAHGDVAGQQATIFCGEMPGQAFPADSLTTDLVPSVPPTLPIALGLGDAPVIALDYLGPRKNLGRKDTRRAPRRTCSKEDLALALSVLEEEKVGSGGAGERKGGKRRRADGGGGEGGRGEISAAQKALLRKFKSVPQDCRWLEFEALTAGRTAVVFSRRAWEWDLVGMMEYRKPSGVREGGGEGGTLVGE